MNQIIEGLVESRGIESAFIDAWGNPTTISDDTKIKLLKAMGYQVDDVERLEQQLEDNYAKQWLGNLNPVQVIKHDESFVFPLRVSIEMAAQSFALQLVFEDGVTHHHIIEPVDYTLINVVEIEDEELHEYAISLDLDLPLGYHKLTLLRDGIALSTSSIIKVPKRCFIPEDIAKGKKIWGLSVNYIV